MLICTYCGWEGEAKRRLRGSKTVEVLIYSTVLFPGPLYSIWRRMGREKNCPHCGLPGLVKTTSDAGWLARRKFDIELGLLQPKVEAKPADDLTRFGNDRPETAPPKKPVNPEEW